jgi:tRNA 2-thiouridine synthesizing protein A
MVIHVVTDDSAVPLDLPAWCHLTGHDYLGPVTSPLGPAHAIRLAADAKPADDRQPLVRRA